MRSRIVFASLASALALCAACSNGGGSSSSQSSTSPSNGAAVFQANCSSCHQAQGQGEPGVFPPLAGNPVVTGPAATVIGIVKHGLAKPITVKGVTYNGQMPAWGQTLSASDIAAVLTYIRHSWGNSASGVTPAQVASTP